MPRLSKIGAAALAAFGWTSGAPAVTASYLVVAGGAGGSNGGGGAGGYRTGTASLSLTDSYAVTVGAGGAGGNPNSTTNGVNGSSSVFNAITSAGGGGGGNGASGGLGLAGGSGGGGGGWDPTSTGGAGNTPSTSPSQGNNGGTGANSGGAGGGGAGAVGSNGSTNTGGAGGAGTASSITGSSVTYAGGGGGRGFNTAGAGGSGGGGAGTTGSGTGSAGTANLGGGGGGSGATNAGGNGGSGVVIISYPSPQKFGGGIVTTSGANTIHTFTTSGTLSPLSTLTASYLIVAGGGGGGTGTGFISYREGAGGGGAGGLLTGSGVTIDTNSTYLVTVGAGGAVQTSGTNSLFSMVTTTAVGGGRGGDQNTSNAGSGGSGGGAGAQNTTVGTGTSGQGSNGGQGFVGSGAAGGGGGGASAVGANGASGTGGGAGGNGTASSISGASVTYAGGGGGGGFDAGGNGGTGGGGRGASQGAGYSAVAGTANLGGGGGGGSTDAGGGRVAAAGGSGVVVISYAGSTQLMAGGTVTISGGNVIHTFTSSGYLTPLTLVGNSLRFRSSASAYLNRTPTTAGNRKTWTWSGWVKRGALSGAPALFSAGTGTGLSDEFILGFSTGNTLFIGASNVADYSTTAVFRDPAAWYHIVLAVDTTQAVAANRTRLWVNNLQLTFDGNLYGTQNTDTPVNNTVAQNIARRAVNGSNLFDGYMTEVQLIDGQALTPNSFGTFNQFGVWQPIRYGGSYGTNGFYLPFSNNASTTTLGLDFSPQGNNWTTNNISVTAGVTYDSMTDVPTLTSTTAANYCVWNPLQYRTSVPTTYSNANLKIQFNDAGTYQPAYGTFGIKSGKYYWEVTVTATGTQSYIGIADINSSSLDAATIFRTYANNGNKNNGITSPAYGASYTTNDVIGIAIDADNGTLTFYKNGASQGTAYTDIVSAMPSVGWTAYAYGYNGTNLNGNWGQQPFVYTAPSGFLPLNTFNL